MTIKQSIIKELENTGDWVFGGKLSDTVAELHKAKSSNVERRCRELCNEGFIEHKYVENPNGSNKVVMYRIKKLEVLPQYRREEIRQQTLV